ncbi:EAL domain-containing protein [Shewanella chilikensis]|uniref:EAL domain-containing protein n=1 Tax=Shewanella chilikensis TaxID=558541 RepID=UPI003006912B
MEQSIFLPLAQNAAFLLALVFMYDAIPRQQQRDYFLLWRLLIGVIIGGICIALMLTPWNYEPGIFFDSRSVLLSISGLFFGGLPTLIACSIAAAFRIYQGGGEGVLIGVGVILSSGLLGLLWRRRRKQSLADIGYWELAGFSLLVHLLMLAWMLLLPWDTAKGVLASISLPVLTLFPLTNVLLGRLLSRRLEFERDNRIRLQDDFLFRSQFNIGNIGISITARDQHWLKINPHMSKMLGYTEQELMQLTWSEMTHPDDLPADMAQFRRMLDGEIDEYEMEKRFITKAGDYVYTHMTVACQRYHQQVQLVIAGYIDITSAKLAEQASAASREQLELVLQSGQLGFWDWDPIKDTVVRNKRSAEILGCSLDNLNDNKRLWLDGIHPKDRAWVLRSLDEHLAGKTKQHQVQYRLIRPDGELRWVQDTGKVVSRDEKGRPLRVCGVHVDITEQKQQEASLKLAASVYENSSEAMSVLDEVGTIITVNSAFSAITGYQAEDILGSNIDMLKCDDHEEVFYRELSQAFEHKGRWQGEMWLRCSDGRKIMIWLSINTIHSSGDAPLRRVALFSDITDKKQNERLIWRQANYDALTGLPNRRMFTEHLGNEIRKAVRHQQRFALLFLDLDFFKEVNDTLGHDMGDLLLVETSERLQACVRESDVVARLGGDEFTLLLSDVQDHNGVERVANHILSSLAEPFKLGDETAFISASIGITLYPDDGQTVELLLKHADQAMYAAKDQGRNRFNYFTASMQEYARYRMRLIQDLRQALERCEFELRFQPIVELGSGKVFKAEALLRWNHSERGSVSPAEFIPVAEDTGLIFEIGNWVFEQAARQSAAWRKAYGREVQISINKSPIQFRDEGNRFAEWLELLASLEVSGSGICIEITEGLLLDAKMGVSDKLLAYRDAGIQVSLDDFGTGYSSLAYLKRFDIDYLKIDQSFTRNLETDESDLTLCEAIIVMAHKLGMKVIAEGVETAGQAEILTRIGCDYAQGYLYSQPLDIEGFEQKYLGKHQVIGGGNVS